ncbi:MAG: GNAT family N-acetyltransferase [Microscillaceae bacterium]|nr:GNAT family N-acetyltransferase [Microscillaceae bacterium]
MKIRKAVLEDHPFVLKFALGIVRQHQSFNPIRFVRFENHEQKLSDLFQEELQNPKTIISLLEIEGKPVGMAFVRMEEMDLVNISSECAWLHDIYIEDNARGTGGGKLLLDAAKEAATALGSDKLMLHVSPQNLLAQNLFTSSGFEPVMYEMMFDLNK